MRILFFYIAICCLFSLSLAAQENNTLKGKILFLNSGNTPAVGVEISGSIKVSDGKTITANIAYSKDDGSYTLIFPKAVVGNVVELSVGDTDGKGQALEIVNEEELRICRIPEDPAEEFEIIACKKGERDVAAQKYYNIIKSSSDFELAKFKKQFTALVDQKQKNYDSIANLSERMTQLEKQADSLTLYKEALRIASINKDNANDRVLKYLKLLDEGTSIQEARKVLSIKSAISELDEGILLFNAAVNELETRAGASKSIFDYKDAIRCYDTLISYSEKMGVDRLKVAGYYNEIAVFILDNGNYANALENFQKSIGIREDVLEPKDPILATSYNNIASTYGYLGQYEISLEYHQKSIAIKEAALDPKDPSLATSYNNIAQIYKGLGQYEKALEYHQKAITIREAVLAPKHPSLVASYNNISLTYQSLGQYENALKYQMKAISIGEAVLGPKHSSLGINYNNIAKTYRKIKDFQKAIAFQEKCLAIFKETLPENHPHQKIALNTMAEII